MAVVIGSHDGKGVARLLRIDFVLAARCSVEATFDDVILWWYHLHARSSIYFEYMYHESSLLVAWCLLTTCIMVIRFYCDRGHSWAIFYVAVWLAPIQTNVHLSPLKSRRTLVRYPHFSTVLCCHVSMHGDCCELCSLFSLFSEDAVVTHTHTVIDDVKQVLRHVKEVWPQFELDGLQNVWIVKPGAKSRGRG